MLIDPFSSDASNWGVGLPLDAGLGSHLALRQARGLAHRRAAIRAQALLPRTARRSAANPAFELLKDDCSYFIGYDIFNLLLSQECNIKIAFINIMQP